MSEVAAGLEPPFGVFLLPGFASRAKNLTFKLWLRNEKFPRWKLWYHMDVVLAALKPVPPPALDEHNFLCANTVLWCFGNTHYCLPSQVGPVPQPLIHVEKPIIYKPSFTLDHLRQLMTLRGGVQELAHAKQTASEQIDAAVAENTVEPVSVRLRALKFKLHALHKYIARQRTLNDALQSQIYSKKLLITQGLLVIEKEYPQFQEIYKDRLEIAEAQVLPLFDLLRQSVYPHILRLLQSAGTVLQQAFPIELVLATGRLSISGVEFPSSIKEILDVCYYGCGVGKAATDNVLAVDQINAGLCYIVLLLRHLASLVNVLLKHPMRFCDSQCLIVDAVTVVATGLLRVLPLQYSLQHTEKHASYDGSGRGFVLCNAPFEQGLALLNKNLTVLVRSVATVYAELDPAKDNGFTNNIPADCTDNFLWNLQYILLFMTVPA